MSWKRFAVMVILAAGMMGFYATHAQGSIVFGFSGVTWNLPGDVAIGEAQLTVMVSDAGNGQVRFDFFNVGLEACSLTDVYFDDGSLLGIAEIDNSSVGVQFTQDEESKVNPPNLPGGGAIDFEATQSFAADSDPPVEPNGVNPGETLGIVFDLQDGKGFADVLADLGSGALRIGIKVQGFESEGSESFVSGGVIPEPAACVVWSLLGAIGVGVGWWRRRRAG